MGQKVTRTKVDKDVKNKKSQEDTSIEEVVEPTTQNIAACGWEMEQREIGGQVAKALSVLTATGVIEWQVGSHWARACIRVHVGKYDPVVVCERGEWAEDVEFDDFGEPRQEFYGFEDGAYKNLMHHINRNWVYPEGY
jgi:hypothetical protein